MSVLTRHWELKLLALAVSTVLWFFVMTAEKSDLIVSARVELDGVPPGLEVVGEKPESIDVQLHGLRGALARLGPDQVKARLSLAGSRPGEVQLRILPEQIQVPAGITVLRVNPSRVRLTLAPRLIQPRS
jgi:hypothetical protein